MTPGKKTFNPTNTTYYPFPICWIIQKHGVLDVCNANYVHAKLYASAVHFVSFDTIGHLWRLLDTAASHLPLGGKSPPSATASALYHNVP